MVFSLLTNPIQMIISLLLMQGISLTMFRAFLNQAMNRADPLRFSLNFGNQPPNNTQANTLQSTLQSLLPSILSSQPPTNNNQIPTPAPLVDSRMLDLVTLIRALTPPQSPAATTTTGISGTANSPAVSQPIMSAPIFALPTAVASSPPAQQIPQIIIVPQLKTASSDTVQTFMIKPENDEVRKNTLNARQRSFSFSSDADKADDDLNPKNVDLIKISPSVSKRKNKSKLNPTFNSDDVDRSPSSSSTSNGVIVFEAIGVRHPAHRYSDDDNDSVDNVINIKTDYA